MAFDYKDIDGSLRHVISELTRLDAGDGQAIDFITRKDVNAFCALLGSRAGPAWTWRPLSRPASPTTAQKS
jgi:hypothetical protein